MESARITDSRNQTQMNKLLFLSSLLSLLILCNSCVSEETKQARNLLEQAKALQAQNQYNEAIVLLDSLQDVCQSAVAERREALALTRQLRLHISTSDSAELAPRLSELIAELERRDADFQRVVTPDMPDETLMRYKGYDPSRSVGRPFVDAYIQSNGQIELVGGYTASTTVDIVGMRISSSDGTFEVSDTIPYDGGRNYRFTDAGRTHHRLTFSLEAAQRLAHFVTTAPAPLRVTFVRANGANVGAFDLPSDARKSIAETYTYFATYLEIKNIEERLAKHEARREAFYQKTSSSKK